MEKTDKHPMLTSSSRIGFFDSGIGGLTILKQFLPFNAAKYIYVGDTARMPYGSKSPQEIQAYSESIIKFLLDQQCDHIIISCHTATALALYHVKTIFKNAHITGVVESVVEEALAITKTKQIGIIATQATITSKYHEQQLKQYDAEIQVYSVACPLLASAIECGTHSDKALDDLIKSYIHAFETTDIDTLILGSTHYDIIQERIQQLVHPSITVLGASQVMQKNFRTANSIPKNSLPLSCFVTGNKDTFLANAQKIFLMPNNAVKTIRF